MELLLPTLRADFEAVENYRHTPTDFPLDCPIVAFGGLDDPRVSQNRLEAWSVQTSSRFKSIYFSGDHFFINTAKDKIVGSIATETMSFLAVNRKSA